MENEDIINQYGCQTIVRPTYTPWITPIEYANSFIKQYIQTYRHTERLNQRQLVKLIKGSILSITSDMCIGWFKHCGY